MIAVAHNQDTVTRGRVQPLGQHSDRLIGTATGTCARGIATSATSVDARSTGERWRSCPSPAAVQRCAGCEIEQAEDQIDPGKLPTDPDNEIGCAGGAQDNGDTCKGRRQHQTRRRTGGSNQEVGSRRLRLIAESGHTPEQPQLQPLDLDTVAPRDDRVRTLVGEQRREDNHRTT